MGFVFKPWIDSTKFINTSQINYQNIITPKKEKIGTRMKNPPRPSKYVYTSRRGRTHHLTDIARVDKSTNLSQIRNKN